MITKSQMKRGPELCPTIFIPLNFTHSQKIKIHIKDNDVNLTGYAC